MGRALTVLDVLRVAQFTIVDNVELLCGPGLNVLTGETGAGKSIIVDALSLLLGARGSAAFVRPGARQAEIEAVFDVARLPRVRGVLEEAGLPADDQLVLRRVLTADGKSRAYVNGRLMPLATLAAIRGILVDFHGQHEHQSLLRPAQQLRLLDAAAGLTERRRDLAGLVQRFRDAAARRDALVEQQRQKAQRLAVLEEDAERFEAAGLYAGAEAEWRAERGRLANVETLRSLVADVCAVLADGADGSPAASELLGQAVGALRAAAKHDESLRSTADGLAGAQEVVSDVIRNLERYREELESNPEALEAIEQKLHTLDRLKRRYDADAIEDLLRIRDACRDELAALQHTEHDLAKAERAFDVTAEETAKAALALSADRRSAAGRLSKQLSKMLRELGMPDGTLDIAVEPERVEDGELPAGDDRYRLRDTGVDRVTIRFSANAGQPVRPLKDVASGGELSRVMLALKATQAGDIPLFVFDEIDAGIGGNVGVAVAEKLALLSRDHQVFCVTHLPQIAARADTHWSVEKRTRKKETVAAVAQVHGEERARELARMFGDQEAPESALEHAYALLARAG